MANLNPFTWVRVAVKSAFIGGIQDAVEELQAGITAPKAIPAPPPADPEDEDETEDETNPPKRKARAK